MAGGEEGLEAGVEVVGIVGRHMRCKEFNVHAPRVDAVVPVGAFLRVVESEVLPEGFPSGGADGAPPGEASGAEGESSVPDSVCGEGVGDVFDEGGSDAVGRSGCVDEAFDG